MTVLQAFVLGMVQGLTEFLPISSSGHLIIIPSVFGWGIQPLVFDTILHLGTALALIVYFWKDLWDIATKFFTDKSSDEHLMGRYILIGSIPAAVLGYFLEDIIESTFRGVNWVIGFLIVGSVFLYIAEHWFKNERSALNNVKSTIVGVFQSLALFPGVSRSGASISAGMYMGLGREKATRFSFLLAIPTVFGAGLYKALSSFSQISDIPFLMISVGFVTSFIFGFAAIKFLLNFVKDHSLHVFVIYRVVLVAYLILFFIVFV